jgi:TnpA family transposase
LAGNSTKASNSTSFPLPVLRERGRDSSRQFEEQTTHGLCLNLTANAIITWNTVYMAEVVDAPRAEGLTFSSYLRLLTQAVA